MRQYVLFLRLAPALLSVIVAFSFAASVLYELGFLQTFSLSLSEVPLSLSDYSESALAWLPFICLTVLGGIFIDITLIRLEGRYVSDEDRIRSYKNANVGRLIVHGWKKLILVIAILGLIIFIVLGHERFDEIFGVIAVLIFFLAYWVLNYPSVYIGLPRWYIRFVVLLFAASILIYLYGRASAVADINTTAQYADLSLSGKAPINENVYILQTYEKYILCWNPGEKKIQVIRTNRIDAISWPYKYHVYAGVINMLFESHAQNK